MKSHLRQFKSHLVFEQNLSPNSIDAYERDVSRFFDFLEQTGISSLEQTKPRHIHRLLQLLSEMGLSPTSLARNLSSIRAFYRFAIGENILKTDPTLQIDHPKLPRRLPSVLTYDEVKNKLKELVPALFEAVPCGVGSKGKLRLTPEQLDDVLVRGVNWAVDNGYGVKDDIEHTEEKGCMEGADPKKVSDLAKKRGLPQLGTLGAGNHFLEIQKVSEIFDEEYAISRP